MQRASTQDLARDERLRGSAQAGLRGRRPGVAARSFSPRQKEVLDKLETIFFREGMEVTVAELARLVGCSRRTLYDIAASKGELFLLVLDRMMRRLGKGALEAAARERSPERRIEAFLAAAVTTFQPARTAFVRVIEGYGPASQLFDEHLTLARAFLVDAIEDGIALGRFIDVPPSLAAEVLLAAVRRVTEPGVLASVDVTVADGLEESFQLIIRGLLLDGVHAE